MELESKPLDWWMRNLHEMSRGICLWISNETDNLSLETVCFIVDDDMDLSAEEQDLRDVDLENSGLMCFLFKDQLEDIQQNLKAQKPNYGSSDLYTALNYYWENDAFIDLKNV